MSHGITDRDTAWFYNAPAWHGLGEVATKRPKDAREWLAKTGLAWAVDLDELVTIGALERALRNGGKDLSGRQLLNRARDLTLADYRATVRADTLETLGVVSDEYADLQNAWVFNFLENIMGRTVPETAFSLYGGKQVGALTRIPESIEIGGDETRIYVYARWRHDGAGALWIFPTAVRVVCANTDRAAITEAGGADSEVIHKIRHRGEHDQSTMVAEARHALKITIDASKQLKKLGDRLARQQVSERQLAKVLEQLYPAGIGAEGGPTSTRGRNNRLQAQESVAQLFRVGDTRGNSPGSKWCLYQAAIEHNQHHRSVRTLDDQVAGERRFTRAFEDPEHFGSLALAAVQAA